MTWVLPLLAGWAVWLLLDHRLPPHRVLELAAGPVGPPRPRRPWAARPARRPCDSGPGGLSDIAASVDLLAVAVSAGYSLH